MNDVIIAERNSYKKKRTAAFMKLYLIYFSWQNGVAFSAYQTDANVHRVLVPPWWFCFMLGNRLREYRREDGCVLGPLHLGEVWRWREPQTSKLEADRVQFFIFSPTRRSPSCFISRNRRKGQRSHSFPQWHELYELRDVFLSLDTRIQTNRALGTVIPFIWKTFLKRLKLEKCHFLLKNK